ncbi:hypothetical protein KXW98_007801 [Aspergillus fumigatus]|uniref:Uncharacterized protein n=1 Tax=Aspergillus fumigatus TaxID=746128 RepID=A0A8H4HM60_ASPFM|nr:hypothetical protein CNMCM8714_004815 [Aspergillus fumigatus]KAF4259721.1 hypothetical protein CNMCM8057_002652 [Aspergillus fumigatus]KAH1272363.1 hypothetical protein KXX45_009454 [Aspergillus fumigatus]KAH1277276.1 hypothetical protein KXX48_005290 [Aspergillus fumigatus]KAH1303609.1 hypothetical protein KXX11_001887 [Aspergillus fumigatus]
MLPIAPINEPVDNRAMRFLGTPAALSENGSAWVLRYQKAVLSKSNFASSTNLEFDQHNYYFAGRGAAGQNVNSYICADAAGGAGDDGKFPVLVGKWSIQAEYNHTFLRRERVLNTGLYAFAKHAHGKFSENATVSGEGTRRITGTT